MDAVDSTALTQAAVTPIIVLGTGPAAWVLGSILKAPVVARNRSDSAWDWPARLPERVKFVLVAPGDGVDRVLRHHADAWLCRNVSRLGVLIFGVEPPVREALLERDVFGRRSETTSRFRDWQDVIRILDLHQPLTAVLAAVDDLELLPMTTWQREAKNASCIPGLLDAIRARDTAALRVLVPQAKDVFWDAICPHRTANAIAAWLERAAGGNPPNWDSGEKLFEQLAHR